MQKGITIAILSLNRKEYLNEVIESILKQTKLPEKIIIFDNGSDNEVYQSITKYINDRINWVGSSESNSAFWNFRRAVELVKTEFIAILHDDDRLCENFIEENLKFLNANLQVGAVSCNGFIINECGKRTGQILRPSFNNRTPEFYKTSIDIAKIYASDLCIPMSPIVYRSDFIRLIKKEDHEKIYNEYEQVSDAVFLTELVKCGVIAYQAKNLYECRWHVRQDSGDISNRLILKLENYFLKLNSDDSKEIRKLHKLIIRQHTSRILMEIIKEFKKTVNIKDLIFFAHRNMSDKFSLHACTTIVARSLFKKLFLRKIKKRESKDKVLL